MNTNRGQLRGSALTIAAVMTGVIGLALVGYLRLLSTEQSTLQRAQIWNFALPMAEAGVEEALTHVHYFAHGSNLLENGWLAPRIAPA